MRARILLISLCLLAPQASAQIVMKCAGDGGAVPGNSTLQLQGTPNTPFLLLFSQSERVHTPLPGLTLAIDLGFLGFCLGNPLFVGMFDSAGKASTTIPVPSISGLYGARMSMQSLEVNPIGNASNLVRLTLQQPDTFIDSLSSSVAPILTGRAFVQSNGKVLLLGGTGPVVQEYDPALEKFRIVGIVPSANIIATQTMLKDGTVLVTGGIGLTGQPVKGAFLFDPSNGTATVLAGMGTARAGHAAALMKDGRVLIVGGASSLDFSDLVKFLAGIRNSSEFYDPKTKTFTAGPALLEAKMFHTATTLSNGEVLVAGGLSIVPVLNIPIVSPTAQAYTPLLNLFGFPRLMAPRMLHSATALANGKALIAGGLTIDFIKFLQTQNIADLTLGSVADVVTYSGGLFGGFSKSYPLSKGRMLPSVAPLGSKGALIAGGFLLDLSANTFQFQALKEADVFTGSSISAAGSMKNARIGGVAVTLPDGTVLVTGGGSLAGEIYQPK